MPKLLYSSQLASLPALLGWLWLPSSSSSSSSSVPYTLIYARTSCQNVFCCPRQQQFQFALTSRPGSHTASHSVASSSSSSSSSFGLWVNPFAVAGDGRRFAIRLCHCHGLPLRHAILLIWFGAALFVAVPPMHNFACEIWRWLTSRRVHVVISGFLFFFGVWVGG